MVFIFIFYITLFLFHIYNIFFYHFMEGEMRLEVIMLRIPKTTQENISMLCWERVVPFTHAYGILTSPSYQAASLVPTW